LFSQQVQPVEVKRSEEKTIINGKVFYVHTVLKGQTLYSISKAYGVSQVDIIHENPGLDDTNLREGQALKIPAFKMQQAAAYPVNRDDFYEHRIRRGQTVYSLSKKYHVSEEMIYRYNPWAREGIKADQTLWIPRSRELTAIDEDEELPASSFYYTVKEKDTLYNISKIYGISVEALIASNPDLKWGLKAGQILKIPRPQYSPEDMLTQPDSLQYLTQPCMPSDRQATYTVALLLPFFTEFSMEETLERNDTITEEGTYMPVARQIGLRGRSFLEFYEGFLLALDSLKKTGMSVNLHVYDTERDSLLLKRILRELSLVRPDLIIGPVYSESVQMAGNLARYQEINLVSPLSTRPSLTLNNPRIFQVIPPKEAENEAFIKYIDGFDPGRIWLIRGTDSISMVSSWRFKRDLLASHPGDEFGNTLKLKDYMLNDSLLANIDDILSRDEENYIVVFSESEPDVSRLVSMLYRMSGLFRIRLFGMPSWQVWKTIDLNYFHTLQLNLITPFYFDYDDVKVKHFLTQCRNEFGYEPYDVSPKGYNFCMLGYDIGFYFLSALKRYGRDFQNCLDRMDIPLLLSSYHFAKNLEGGYVNNTIQLIRYNSDFKVEKVVALDGTKPEAKEAEEDARQGLFHAIPDYKPEERKEQEQEVEQ
jgi:LysM repeat protein